MATMTRAAALLLTVGLSTPAFSAEALQITVLSSRPEMVTGGDALVAITGGAPDSLTVRLNGRDARDAFRSHQASRALLGNLTGLRLGRNVVEAASGSDSARLEIINHALSGPVFSGPRQEPFICETERAGLGPALDENCFAETRTALYYRSTDRVAPRAAADAQRTIPRGFKLYDASQPRPSDMARTTTTTGRTTDFIVRVETGVLNRAVYQIAALHDPAAPDPTPWSRPASWNGRLVYRFGGGCKAGYRQGRPSSALQAGPLSQGYAVAASSLNVFGNDCNDVVSAETLMMVKERFIKTFGPPIHTIGTGGSGGSMQQHLIAQNYPGLLDGIIPGSSYPDILTLIPPVTDCSLLARAFEQSGLEWTDEQKSAVSGFAAWRTCESWMRNFSPQWLTPGSCDAVVPEHLVYSASHNSQGVRCGIHDNQVNMLGRDPATGRARRALDNVGVQYGLEAFNNSVITVEQFVELNETVGGYDLDGRIVPERSVADQQALQAAYSTGRVNLGAGSLRSIPIIDTRVYRDPSGNIHDRIRTFAVQARLEKAGGAAANRVMLTNPPAEIDAVRLIDEWLTAVTDDDSDADRRQSVASNRPAELTDTCWTEDGERIEDEPQLSADGRCAALYPPHGDPRLAAGAPLSGDILKCALKPVDRTDYRRALTDKEFRALKGAFPDGVCDYSKPGVGRQPIAGTWLRY